MNFKQAFNWPKTRTVFLANLPFLLVGEALIAFPDALSGDLTVPVYILPFAVLAMPVVEAVVFIRVYRGATYPDAFRTLGRNLSRFVWASLATFFWVMLGAAMLLLPMFYFMGKMAFAIQVSVAEIPYSRTPVQASHHLTRGKVAPLAIIQAILFVVPYAWQWWAPHWSISFPVTILAGALSTSFLAAAADTALKSSSKAQ